MSFLWKLLCIFRSCMHLRSRKSPLHSDFQPASTYSYKDIKRKNNKNPWSRLLVMGCRFLVDNVLLSRWSFLNIITFTILTYWQNTTKRQFTDFNTVNCRFVRITQVGVHENRYCQIGSISQPLGNPIAARSISGKSTNSQRSFASISLFGDMMSRKYLMTHIVK